MKAYLLFSVLVMVFSQSGYAQEEFDRDADGALAVKSFSMARNTVMRRLIPQFSFMAQNYLGNDSAAFTNANAFSVGVLTDLSLSDYFVIETGLQYRQLIGGYQSRTGTVDYTSDYLTLPVSVKYYYYGQDNNSLYGKFGLSVSALTQQTFNYSPAYKASAANLDSRIWESGALAAIGGKYKLAPKNDIVIEASYNQSMNTLFNNADIYNATWNLTAGLTLEM